MSLPAFRFRSSALGLLPVWLVVVASGGCNGLGFLPLATAEKTIAEVFQTDSAPRIEVDTFNGSIDVSRGNDAEVVVEVTKRAGGFDQATAEAALSRVQVSMVQKGNLIEISAQRLDRGVGNFGAAVVIAVPAGAKLALKTNNGAVVCEDIAGGLEAATSNGRIEIVSGSGPMKLQTTNGAVEITASAAVVDARSTNGRIAFDGTLAEGEHRFHTSNGKIDLALPADARFRFAGSTSNGRIQCDFPLVSEGKTKRSRLNGTVGENPDCSIVAATSNGQITVRKTGTVKP